jgi:hypothetical protein
MLGNAGWQTLTRPDEQVKIWSVQLPSEVIQRKEFRIVSVELLQRMPAIIQELNLTMKKL